MLYRLARPGDVDLAFDGELLADESTRYDDRGQRHVDHSRWTEIRIYKLNSGEGWVVERVGKSVREGETDRPTITVCTTPEEVLDGLKRRPGPKADYLINAAVDALGEAADKDPRLLPVTTERL